MQRRRLGRTGLELSIFGFGCGMVGGLMVAGAARDQDRAIGRALELGVNYFDTAPLYGDGRSERNLGRVLASLRPKDAIVGTKVWFGPDDRADLAGAARRSLDTSLALLGRERVELFQLHNPIGGANGLPLDLVLREVAPAFVRLKQAGKIAAAGFTAVGDTAAVIRLIESGAFETAQVVHNLLNPSAARAHPLPPGFPGQDLGGMLDRAHAAGIGTIGIRALAAGALSGVSERHPLGLANPPPAATAANYQADVARAGRFAKLVQAGDAATITEAALRFVAGNPAMTTTLLGLSSLEQLEHAVAAVGKGALSPAAMTRVGAAWRSEEQPRS
jgi:aryl-alcohol dehydrogenase-like predicted oxidoreductase